MFLVGVVERQYIDFLIIITYPYSSCICSFLQQNPYFLFIFQIRRKKKKKNAKLRFFFHAVRT